MKILVTGAAGFVGGGIIRKLASEPAIQAVAAVRSQAALLLPGIVKSFEIPDIANNADWRPALAGCRVVIHAAARVHVMRETAADPLAEFRRVNVQATLNLARQAAQAGVKRFVFISSVKVNGERTEASTPFTADDAPAPEDAYGISKMEAEMALKEIGAQTNMEIVIIRPPLVYGPAARGNFKTLLKLVKSGFPLPLGSITNKRSLVGLDNLVDLTVLCSTHLAAANQIFLVSDDEDMSTAELLKRLAFTMNKPARLLPFPAGLLTFASRLAGRPDIAQKLCGSLQVDITKTKQLLYWNPPVSVDDGLKKCVENFQ